MTATGSENPARFRRWARLSFYYPALSPDVLAVLPNAVINTYESELPALLAEQQSRALDVISFPHMKPAEQRSITRRLQRQLRSSEPAERIESKSDLKQRASASGIGVKIVKPGER